MGPEANLLASQELKMERSTSALLEASPKILGWVVKRTDAALPLTGNHFSKSNSGNS